MRHFTHEKTGRGRGGCLGRPHAEQTPGSPHWLLSLDHVEDHPGSPGVGLVPLTDLPWAVLKAPVGTDRCTRSGNRHDWGIEPFCHCVRIPSCPLAVSPTFHPTPATSLWVLPLYHSAFFQIILHLHPSSELLQQIDHKPSSLSRTEFVWSSSRHGSTRRFSLPGKPASWCFLQSPCMTQGATARIPCMPTPPRCKCHHTGGSGLTHKFWGHKLAVYGILYMENWASGLLNLELSLGRMHWTFISNCLTDQRGAFYISKVFMHGSITDCLTTHQLMHMRAIASLWLSK